MFRQGGPRGSIWGGVAGRSMVTMFCLRELRSLVGELPDAASALSLREAADRFLPA